ncbi:MAG TPA: hypothetical protein VGP89_15905 [Candidatus Angelobacter sp.]|jgi:hypothetical protein|nr:hypothetical protein [Candidatus Angelobacter sp.]
MMIRSLQSVVDRELAWRSLSPRGALGIVRRWRAGKLLALSDIYIPYRLYQIKVDDHRVRSTRFLAVDAISGALDPYEFAESPLHGRCVEVDAANYLPAQLAEDDSRTLVLEKVRRLLFSGGFFRLVKPAITTNLIGEFYIPYWAGFYGEAHNVSVLILNAVRGTIEGSKASNLVKNWLLERSSNDTPVPA